MNLFSRSMALVLLTGSISMVAQSPAAPATPPPPGLALSSTAFEDGGVIPDKHSQQQPGWVSPALQWKNVPKGTVSFALLMHDPDVALQHKYADVTHWIIFNIPAEATSLPEGVPNTAKLPDGAIQPKNQRGEPGFLGSGAPAGGPYHHYTFELLALDTTLTLGPDATRADFTNAVDGHILGKGILVGRFHKH